ncbi:phage holin family protein [Neisseria sp. Ec49-e6-T10]|uniref:phage holin family protein n=1 Tax=Neisseria sp. Ec49-e6-T10 TaxID=3140744 RepID=UPI003EBC98CE
MSERASLSVPSRVKRIAKTIWDLAYIRAKMFSLEAQAQKEQLITMMILLVALSVCVLFGFVALLFGLNAVLSPEARIWVFFILVAFFLVMALFLVFCLARHAANQKPPFYETLQEIKKDLAALEGRDAE